MFVITASLFYERFFSGVFLIVDINIMKGLVPYPNLGKFHATIDAFLFQSPISIIDRNDYMTRSNTKTELYR